VPRPPASVQASARRAPPVIAQNGAQTVSAQTASAQTISAQTSAAPARTDADKTDALERAIKQYGWSGSNSLPKPSQ
jgi:hypothetical protein